MKGLEFDEIGGLERGWLERRFEREILLVCPRTIRG